MAGLEMLSSLSDFRFKQAEANVKIHTLEECEPLIVASAKAGHKAAAATAEYECANVERMTANDLADDALRSAKREHEALMLIHRFQSEENEQRLRQIDQWIDANIDKADAAKAATARKKLVDANCTWTIEIPEGL